MNCNDLQIGDIFEFDHDLDDTILQNQRSKNLWMMQNLKSSTNPQINELNLNHLEN